VLGLAGRTLPVSRGDRVGSGQTSTVSQSRPILARSRRSDPAGRSASAGGRRGGCFGEQAVGETDEIGGEVSAQRVAQNRAQML
jgi:hypothetical protein